MVSMSERYDLHTHSVYSDGTTRPGEIAIEAAGSGVAGFALTDHDTIDGWDEARAGALSAGVEFLPGIEITTKHGGRSRHLLGYGFDPAAGELLAALTDVRASRLLRAREMVRRLSADYRITWDEVVGADDASTVGRPHIADALVAAGYFADRGAAFADALHPGSPYYLGTYALETIEAIRMIRQAGGVPVLAHPAATRQREPVSGRELGDLAAGGLWGVEIDHPENRPEWVADLSAAAGRLGLTATGASDFHGAGKPNRLGERTSPREVWDAIRALAAVSA